MVWKKDPKSSLNIVTIKVLKRADIFEHHNFFAVTAGLVIGSQKSKSTVRVDQIFLVLIYT
jgi:hypothetical protein